VKPRNIRCNKGHNSCTLGSGECYWRESPHFWFHTSGSALEIIIMPWSFCRFDHHGIQQCSSMSILFLILE
jgi:hypothetical protein